MNKEKYFRLIDLAVMRDSRLLVSEIYSLVCVLIIVLAHIIILFFRIMFPWLIPLLTKEEA